MSKVQFESAVKLARLDAVAQTWFPRWLGRYASYLGAADEARLAVDRERVIAFLRMLRDRQVPAWQRLQAVDAIIAYRSLVGKETEATLADVRLKLIKKKENGQALS